MSSSESHLGLLDSIFRSTERLCDSELCYLGHRRKVSVLCLLYKIYPRVDHSMNKYLKHFIAVRNTRASTAQQMVLVFPNCRITDQFSRSFLPAAVRLWNMLPSGVFSGGNLSSSEITINLCLLRV